jgi:hypothetical protein
MYYPSWSLEDSFSNAPFDELFPRLETRLTEWYQTIRENIILREKLEFHELHYQMQVLRLNRPSPRCPNPTEKMRKKALNACVSVIRELSIIDRLGKLFYLWHSAHCAVEAAVCLLASVLTGIELGSNMTHIARDNTGILTRYIQAASAVLSKISRRWSNITQHASAIEAISTQCLEKLQQWSGGTAISSADSYEVRQKLTHISLFSPFPSASGPVAEDQSIPTGTEPYPVLKGKTT